MNLLKFEAEWCSSCKAQDKILNDFKDIPIVHYDVEEDLDKANEYNIRSLPTMVLIDDNGEEITRFIGTTTLDKIKEVINDSD